MNDELQGQKRPDGRFKANKTLHLTRVIKAQEAYNSKAIKLVLTYKATRGVGMPYSKLKSEMQKELPSVIRNHYMFNSLLHSLFYRFIPNASLDLETGFINVKEN